MKIKSTDPADNPYTNPKFIGPPTEVQSKANTAKIADDKLVKGLDAAANDAQSLPKANIPSNKTSITERNAQIADMDKVKQHQEKLNKYGANLKVDGMWGAKTEAASRDLYPKYKTQVSNPSPKRSMVGTSKNSTVVPQKSVVDSKVTTNVLGGKVQTNGDVLYSNGRMYNSTNKRMESSNKNTKTEQLFETPKTKQKDNPKIPYGNQGSQVNLPTVKAQPSSKINTPTVSPVQNKSRKEVYDSLPYERQLRERITGMETQTGNPISEQLDYKVDKQGNTYYPNGRKKVSAGQDRFKLGVGMFKTKGDEMENYDSSAVPKRDNAVTTTKAVANTKSKTMELKRPVVQQDTTLGKEFKNPDYGKQVSFAKEINKELNRQNVLVKDTTGESSNFRKGQQNAINAFQKAEDDRKSPKSNKVDNKAADANWKQVKGQADFEVAGESARKKPEVSPKKGNMNLNNVVSKSTNKSGGMQKESRSNKYEVKGYKGDFSEYSDKPTTSARMRLAKADSISSKQITDSVERDLAKTRKTTPYKKDKRDKSRGLSIN